MTLNDESDARRGLHLTHWPWFWRVSEPLKPQQVNNAGVVEGLSCGRDDCKCQVGPEDPLRDSVQPPAVQIFDPRPASVIFTYKPLSLAA